MEIEGIKFKHRWNKNDQPLINTRCLRLTISGKKTYNVILRDDKIFLRFEDSTFVNLDDIDSAEKLKIINYLKEHE